MGPVSLKRMLNSCPTPVARDRQPQRDADHVRVHLSRKMEPKSSFKSSSACWAAQRPAAEPPPPRCRNGRTRYYRFLGQLERVAQVIDERRSRS